MFLQEIHDTSVPDQSPDFSLNHLQKLEVYICIQHREDGPSSLLLAHLLL